MTAINNYKIENYMLHVIYLPNSAHIIQVVHVPHLQVVCDDLIGGAGCELLWQSAQTYI